MSVKVIVKAEIQSADDAVSAVTAWLRIAPPAEQEKFVVFARAFVNSIEQTAGSAAPENTEGGPP